MQQEWCFVCCTRHELGRTCPGELNATGPEDHAWRATADTPVGVEAFGILVAQCEELWRARILTYPNILWATPGGRGSMKFAGRTREEAQRSAFAFLQEHCRRHGLTLRDVRGSASPLVGAAVAANAPIDPRMVQRKVRFMPVVYGAESFTERAGTGNLSTSGLFIITESPLGTGDGLQLMLDIEQHPIRMSGEVRWHRPQPDRGQAPGMGVMLHAPPSNYVQYVLRLP